VTSGVPQGSVLGPLLFLCFINDLPDQIKCKIKLYADDVLLYSTINTVDDCHTLQSDLTTLEQWACKWNMVFNPAKCEFLRISNKINYISMHYFIQGQEIQEVSSAKYLGITIDQHLTWNNHVKQVTSKANKIKYFLQRSLKHCPIHVKVNCYNLSLSMLPQCGHHIPAATSMLLKLYKEGQQDLFIIIIHHIQVSVT